MSSASSRRGHRAEDGRIAGVQSGDVLPGLVGLAEFDEDLVEVKIRGVDLVRIGRAMVEELDGDQSTGVQAHRRGSDQIPPANGDEIGRARPGTDEVDSHPATLPLDGLVIW
jgi:hypothetical protein